MNLMAQINDLKGMPDQALQFELANPSGAIPGYLVLAEAQRRQIMRQSAQAQQGQQPVGSVYDDVIRSMMASQPPQGVAPAGATPPPMGPPPTTGGMPSPGKPMGMAEGGEVDDDDGSEDEGGDDDPGEPGILGAARDFMRTNVFLNPKRQQPRASFNLDDAINATAAKYGRDPGELRDVVMRESHGDPHIYSNKGAGGLGQLMPGTARQYGVTDVENPQQNLDATAHYLTDLYKMFGDPRLVHAAYNWGPGNLRSSMKSGQPWPKETRDYVNNLERDAAKRGAYSFTPGHPESVPTGAMTFDRSYRDFTPPKPSADDIERSGFSPYIKADEGDNEDNEDDNESQDEGEEQEPVGPEPPEASPADILKQPDPGALQSLYQMPDVGPRPEAPAPTAAGVVAPAAPAKTARSGEFDWQKDESKWRNILAQMYQESQRKPTIWNALQAIGYGMATSGGRTFGQALAGGLSNFTKQTMDWNEQARQKQLQLMGISLKLDEEARQHQDKLDQIDRQASQQAAVRQGQLFREVMKQPGVYGDADKSPGPGYVSIADPDNPGKVYWHYGNQMQVTDDLVKYLGSNPFTNKPFKAGDWVSTPQWLKAVNDRDEVTRKVAEQKPPAPPKPTASQETQDLRAEAILAQLKIKRDPTMTPTEQLRKEHPEMLGKITSPLKDAAEDPTAGIDQSILAKPIPAGERNVELLNSLPQTDQSMVQGLANYELQLPSSFALSKPYWQRLMQLTKAYDPSFDQGQYNIRQKVRADYTSGKTAQNISALNVAISHLDRLEGNWAALHNYGGWRTSANAPLNWAESKLMGDPRMTAFTFDQTAVPEELSKIWLATGAAKSEEIERWRKALDPNASPAAQQAAIREMYNLTYGKLQDLKSSYETKMGSPANFHLLRPDTIQRFKAHGIDPVDLAPNTKYGLSRGPVENNSITVRTPDGGLHPFSNERDAKKFEDAVKNAGGTTTRE